MLHFAETAPGLFAPRRAVLRCGVASLHTIFSGSEIEIEKLLKREEALS
jgi:hypothetical protein